MGVQDRPQNDTAKKDNGMLLDIPCLKSVRELLYVVVRRTANTPLFDTRFSDYGFNRQEWIQHLRYAGYEFRVFQHGFGVEIFHPMSPHYMHFVEEMEQAKESGTKPQNEVLFDAHMESLKGQSKKVLYNECTLWPCLFEDNAHSL